jgi:SNF2 family DNA or RNA helicase
VSDYIVQFGQSTLENWQSEFLQLFSFVVLSAVLIHHGSAESKDSDERMENTLRRIEQKLDEQRAA